MSSVKKLICILSFLMIFLISVSGNVNANQELISNKKIVSMVFDDSGSMEGEKEENANYALQALISMLGVNDELNIVKMSDPYTEISFDLKNKTLKQASIDKVRDWNAVGGTPFDAVDTARNFLYKRKESLKAEAEYWLIIITDGQFNTYAAGNNVLDIEDYIDRMNENFNGMIFDAILLSIGNELDYNFTQAFSTSKNCSLYEAASSKEIISTMFEISSQINSRLNAQMVETKKLDSNKISIDLKLPVYKMNIFIQKNGLEISDIKSEKKDDVKFDIYNISTSRKNAKMNETNMESGYLERGKYIVTFSDEVDLDATQIKILVQVAVNNVARLYKRDNKKDIALEYIDLYKLSKTDKVIAKSELISRIDGKPIDISSLNKVDGYYYINERKSYGKFEDNFLVTDIFLESGENTIYSLIDVDGFVNAQSNVISINWAPLPEVLIQYNNSETFVKNGEIVLDNIPENAKDITLQNLPNGVVIEYEKLEYRNNEKILLAQGNKTLIVKADKNYRSTKAEIVEINFDGDIDESQKAKQFFIVRPKTAKYEFIKINENQTDINMDDGLLKLGIKYQIEGDSKILEVDDIKKFKLADVTNGYSIKTKLDSETNEIILKVTPNILSIFNMGKINFKISADLKDSLGYAEAKYEFNISNYDLLKILLPLIIGFFVLLIICGYLFKNRFGKKACIKISNENQPYSLRESVTGVKKYLPFVSDKVILPNIELKAKSGKKIELISSCEEVLEVNGESEIPKKIILRANNGEFVLKVGSQNVKYEYVTLTPDEIIETSEEKNNNENWF